MLRSRGIIVDPRPREVRGVLFSSFLGRTRVETTESAPSVEELLSAFPADAPITLLLPGRLFMARTVILPFTDAKTIRKTLPFELEGTLPLPIDQVLLDSVPAHPADTRSHVMVLAIPKTTVAEYMTLFPEGRRPTRVIPDFIALLSLGVTPEPEDETFGVLDVERDSTSIVVIAGGRPVMMRSIGTNTHGASITEWVEATIKSLEDEGHTAERLYVTGVAARHAVPLLEPIVDVIPLAQTVHGVGRREWPVWATLAGGALSASRFAEFNILDVNRATRFRGILRILSIGIGLVLILGTVDLYVRDITASKTLALLRAESRGVFLAAMPNVRNVVKEDAQLRVALMAERQTREALIGNPSPSYRPIGRGLAKIVVDHPELRVREAAVEGTRLTVSGDGRGIGTEALKKVFAEIEGAHSVQVEEIVQGVEPNSYRFRVKVEMR